MRISNELVPGASDHTGPVLVLLEHGIICGGFVLADNEFVTSFEGIKEVRNLTGLPLLADHQLIYNNHLQD